VVVACDIV